MDAFERKETVLIETEKRRLINIGAGPKIIQEKEEGKWKDVNTPYQWSELCLLAIDLNKEVSKPYILPDTAISKFAQDAKAAKTEEEIESLLIVFIEEHFQFKV